MKITKRSETIAVKVKDLSLGSNDRIYVQSMCDLKTSRVDEVVAEIRRLTAAGCDIIRLSVLDDADIAALKTIVKLTSTPIVADIHFDYRLAVRSIEAGVAKVRVNPGNLGPLENFRKVIECAAKRGCAVRIGLNGGSMDEKILKKHRGNVVNAMIDSARRYVEVAEKLRFHNIVLSFKSSDVETTIKVNEKAARTFKYPLHLGVTEAGSLKTSLVRSSAALGVLLREGIGNTIRISITGDPIEEVFAAKELLNSLGLRAAGIRLVSCPTCGRCQVNLVEIVEKLQPQLNLIKKNLTVAVMGCPVNGPGEAKNADIGVAGGKDKFVLFKKGRVIGTYPSERIIDVLLAEIEKM